MLLLGIFGKRHDAFDDFFDFGFPMLPEISPVSGSAVNGLMRTDIRENDGNYELSVNIPGVKKEDIKVMIENGYLIVAAEYGTGNDEKDDDGKYIRRERYFGSASRRFYIGEDVMKDDIKAKYENGVVLVSFPKKEAEEKAPEKKYIAIEG